MPSQAMIVEDVVNLSGEDRTFIGQAVTQYGDGKHPAPSLDSIGGFRVAYVRECLVRAREAGSGYPEKLAALSGRLLAAVRSTRSSGKH